MRKVEFSVNCVQGIEAASEAKLIAVQEQAYLELEEIRERQEEQGKLTLPDVQRIGWLHLGLLPAIKRQLKCLEPMGGVS